MAIKIQPISELLEDSGLKILVHGPAGVGKTVLASTTNAFTLFISAEAGLLSLKNSMALDERDLESKIDGVTINSIDELSDVYEEIRTLKMEKCKYKWIVLDSVTEIAEVLLSEEKKINKDPRKSYGNLIDEMSRLIRKFRDLPNINVLMTCKQQRVTDEFSGITSYVPMMPGKNLSQQMPYWFDEVFAMRIFDDEEGGQYRALQTFKDVMYEAKDRSGKLLPYEKPDVEHIYNKIHNTGE